MAEIEQVVRLRQIIKNNKAKFEKLKAQAQRWRDRALVAEAALEELRRAKRTDGFGNFSRFDETMRDLFKKQKP